MKIRTLSIIALTFLLAALVASAQTTPTAPVTAPTGFVASSDVLAIGCNGGWGAGNLTTESYDLIDYGAAKANKVFAQGVELSAPNCGLSVYGGGLLWQPDISKLLKKTNISTGNVVVFFDGSIGNGMPSAGPNRVSAILGGGLKYIMTDNLTWNTIRFEEVFFGSQRYPSVSTGIAVYFGGTPASPAVSSNVKRSLLRRMTAATKITQ